MDSSSVQDSFGLLVKSFTDQIKELKALSVMRVPDTTGELWGEELDEISQSVKEIEKALSQLKQNIATEKQFIPQAMKLKAAVKKQEQEIGHMLQNLPSRLPGAPEEKTDSNKENFEENSNKEKEIVSSHPPQKKSKKIKIETIPYVTKDELEAIPKYVKGRVTQEKVNSAIDEIHSILEAKYKLIACNYIKLNGEALKKFKAYKEEETTETKGIFFFSENIDMKNLSHLKLDATGKAILAVLRTLNRIRDLGGAARRYAIIS